MKQVWLVRIDKIRPVVLLSRTSMLIAANRLLVAPIVSQPLGLGSEVAVSSVNGLDRECVIACDRIQLVRRPQLMRQLGTLSEEQDAALAQAVLFAFELS